MEEHVIIFGPFCYCPDTVEPTATWSTLLTACPRQTAGVLFKPVSSARYTA